MSLLTSIDDYVMKGNAKLASTTEALHAASPLITTNRELNPIVNGAVPDYKATAIALARALLQKQSEMQVAQSGIQQLAKAHSDQLKNVMVLVGAISALRPLVEYVRANPLLWAFIPRTLKQPIDMILAMVLPGDGGITGNDRGGFDPAAEIKKMGGNA